MKDLRDMPVNISVVTSYFNDVPSFTLTLEPKEEFIRWAESQMQGTGAAWKSLAAASPHHKKSLAYARVAYDGKSMVVNNLQRDADSDAIAPREMAHTIEVAKWWDKQTKNWDLFLLHVIKAMAIANNKKAYVSSYDAQRKKWSNLPIHKARKSYEDVPQGMGMELEDAPGHLIERTHDNEAWRMASKRLYSPTAYDKS
jgi:hypothetical protein